MKLRDGILAAVFTALSYVFFKSYSGADLPLNIDGYHHPAFKQLADVFRYVQSQPLYNFPGLNLSQTTDFRFFQN